MIAAAEELYAKPIDHVMNRDSYQIEMEIDRKPTGMESLLAQHHEDNNNESYLKPEPKTRKRSLTFSESDDESRMHRESNDDGEWAKHFSHITEDEVVQPIAHEDQEKEEEEEVRKLSFMYADSADKFINQDDWSNALDRNEEPHVWLDDRTRKPSVVFSVHVDEFRNDLGNADDIISESPEEPEQSSFMREIVEKAKSRKPLVVDEVDRKKIDNSTEELSKEEFLKKLDENLKERIKTIDEGAEDASSINSDFSQLESEKQFQPELEKTRKRSMTFSANDEEARIHREAVDVPSSPKIRKGLVTFLDEESDTDEMEKDPARKKSVVTFYGLD